MSPSLSIAVKFQYHRYSNDDRKEIGRIERAVRRSVIFLLGPPG